MQKVVLGPPLRYIPGRSEIYPYNGELLVQEGYRPDAAHKTVQPILSKVSNCSNHAYSRQAFSITLEVMFGRGTTSPSVSFPAADQSK